MKNMIEYTMVAFLDIEGAFNNVKLKAITDAFANLKVDNSLGVLINQLLTCRIINTQLGRVLARRNVCCGTPQGGALSPLLWDVVANELLVDLDRSGCRLNAYADDAYGVIVWWPALDRAVHLTQLAKVQSSTASVVH